MEVSYKIPKTHIILVLGLVALFPMGTFGYLDDSFSQTNDAKLISLLLFLGLALYFYVTPRDRKIIASSSGISVPRVFLPPYTTKTSSWEDIVGHKYKFHRNGTETLVLQTRSGNIKIHSLLFFRDYEFSFTASAYEEIQDYIFTMLSERNHAH